jgi:cell division protein FtsB
VREDIARAKYVPQAEMEKIRQIRDTIEQQMKQLHSTAASK